MKNVIHASQMRTKIVDLQDKWQEVITFLTVFCAFVAAGFGVSWFFFKQTVLLHTAMVLSSFYFIGKTLWKFRHEPI